MQNGSKKLKKSLEFVAMYLVLLPNQQRWHAKWKPKSERVHVACTFTARFGRRLVMLSRRFSAKDFCIGPKSEVYYECVVGWVPSALVVRPPILPAESG